MTRSSIATIGLAVLSLWLGAFASLAAGRSDVADAAQRGDSAAVRALIQQKADINALQAGGASALHWAVHRNDAETVKLLIDAGANVRAETSEGITPLYLAALYGNTAIVEALLRAGARPKEVGPNDETTVMLAVRNGNADVIRMLAAAGVNVNAVEPLRGTTALMWAAEQKHPEAVQALIAVGANVNASALPSPIARPYLTGQVNVRAVQNLNGTTANTGAANGGRGRGAGAAAANRGRGRGGGPVIEAPAEDPDAPPPPPLQVMRNPDGGNLGAVTGLLLLPDGSAAVGVRVSALEASPPGDRNQMLASVGETDGSGRFRLDDIAPGSYLIIAGSIELPVYHPGTLARSAAALITVTAGSIVAGVDFTIPAAAIAAFPSARVNTSGLTALMFAAREGDLESARLLVAAGADVNQATNAGWTPLLTAIENRNYKIAAFFVDRGADVNKANSPGLPPLYLAVDNRNIEDGDYPVPKPDVDHLEIIKQLLDHGANVDGRTATNTLTRTIHTMQWLFEPGATPFLRAAQSGDLVVMRLLLARGADPKAVTDYGDTALAVAAGIGWVAGVTYEWSREANLETVRMLLDFGLNPNSANREGRTPLMGAAHKGRNEIVQLLVDRGAKLETRDLGSRDTSSTTGKLAGHTWQAVDYADGMVRVGVQTAIDHPETAQLIRKLMADRGLPAPPPNRDVDSVCVRARGCN